MSQVTIISGVERRRGWRDEQKRALVAAAREPGVSVSDSTPARGPATEPAVPVAARSGQACGAGFTALTVSSEPETVAPGAAVVLEIGGAALRIASEAPPGLVSVVVRSLRR